MDEIDFLEQFRPAAPTTVAEVLARVASVPDRADLAAAAAERAEADARAERYEARMLANRMTGNPLGEVSRMQAVVSEAREQVQELEGQLEKARDRLSRASETLAHWGEQADEVYRASVQRSDTADLLGPAKETLAGHRAYLQASRAAWEAAQAGTPRRESRPFASRGRVAVRSHLECVYCLREGVDAETSALLHHDPTWDVPITTAEQAEQAEHAERRGRRGYAEISR
jgi:hypothetical protein